MVNCCESKLKWEALLGAFIALFIADGWICSFGMIYFNLLSAFDESRAATSYIPTFLYGLPLLMSPFTCSVASRIGCRILSIFAGIILCISFVLSSLCTSLWAVCCVTALLTSLGLTSLLVSALVTVTYSFDHGSRGLATGVATAGSGLGVILFPQLIDYLLEEYMWQGTYLIMGGICLNVIISGYLYKPFPKNQLSGTDSECAISVLERNDEYERESKFKIYTLCVEIRRTALKILGGVVKDAIKVTKRKLFTFFCVVHFVQYIWINVPYVYTYDWASESLGIDHSQGAWLLSTQGIALTAGMIVNGFLVDSISKVGPNFVYGINMAASGVCVVLVPHCRSYTLLLVCCGSFSFANSATFVLPFLTAGEIVGMDWAVAGSGVVYFVQGVSILIGTPIGGWIRDLHGSYELAFLLAGLFMISTGSMFCVFGCLKSSGCKSASKDIKVVGNVESLT